MAEARVFGPIRGAGTQVNEQVGQEGVDQGKLGSTVIAGPFERGLEDDITITTGMRSYFRKMGEPIDPADVATPTFTGLWASLCGKHFWERSKGAGSLICLRVTPKRNDVTQDDRPTHSTILLWNREAVPKLLGAAVAHNGGNWGGKRRTYLSKISGVPGVDFPAANQIQLTGLAAKTLKNDEFRGATVTLDGLPGYSYRVENNGPTGLLTLAADQDVEGDWGSGETYGQDESSVGPFNFATCAAPYTLITTTDLGGPITVTFAAVAAGIAPGAVPTLPIAGGAYIDVAVNGVTYRVDVGGVATVPDLIDALNAVPGLTSIDNPVGQVTTTTDRKGTGATFTVVAVSGTTEDAIWGAGHVHTATGTGDVADHMAVTATEIVDALNADVPWAAIATAIDDGDGSFTVRTDTVGSTGTYQHGAGTINAACGLDTALHTGTDGPSDLHVQIERDNLNTRGQTKAISIEFKDGGLRASTEFGVVIRVDDKVVLSYENLSMRTDVANYWASVINNDVNNDIVTITDSFTGDRTLATARPANIYGESKALTTTRLTIPDPTISSLVLQPGSTWAPTLTWNSWGAQAKPQMLRVTYNGPGYTVTTDQGNRTWAGTIGAALDMEDFVGNMTVATVGAPVAGDTFVIYLKPLEPDEAIGGRVYPNVEDVSQRNQNFVIIDNSVSYVDVSAMDDLTDAGSNTAGKEFRIEYKQQLASGYDGYIAGMTSSDYEQLFDISTSPLNKLKGRGYGEVKIAIPGVTYLSAATALQQKIRDFAAAKNWVAKVEIPWTYHDWDVYYEKDLVDYIDNTLGRSEYSCTHFPSYSYIRDPFASAEAVARNVLVPSMGMILGEEARTAVKYQGYHKAPAGVDAQLPDVVELPVIGKPESPLPLDEETLNPAGINVVKWRNGGNVVILWGDRTLAQTAAFKFYHKRCLLSQYENDLLEGFDFNIFEINDPINDAAVLAALHDYFLPEFRKRAIRGSSFVGGTNPAAIFKMDAENNTNATRDAGDQIVEISLRLADTVERLRIFIGAMGVVEGSI